jgi:hypothetical protein
MTETTAKPPAVQEPSHLSEIARLGQWLALAEADDHTEKGRGAAAALRLYWAEQLGLAPMAANDIPVIKGRPYVQANVARALAHRQGYRVEKVDSSDQSCTAVIYQGDTELGRETFTMAQAKAAGIVRDKTPWTTYPARMLWAKAARFVIQDHAPEVLLGIGLVEEIGEVYELPESEVTEEPDLDEQIRKAQQDPVEQGAPA